MAEREKITHEEEKVVTEKNTSVPHSGAVVAPRRHTQRWVTWVVIIVVLIYLILVIGGIMIFHAVGSGTRNNMGSTITSGQRFNRGPGYVNQQTYTVRSDNSDGLTTTSTNTTYTRTEGVVTAVNSDTIVVAGGGKTQTITTNSSTMYDNDTKPAVNDTVVVIGTESGTTITATEVEVFNQ